MRKNIEFRNLASRQSRPVSSTSFNSMTPIIDRSSMNSSVQSNRTITPEMAKKNDEHATRLEKLRADAAFVVSRLLFEHFHLVHELIIQAIKYTLHREDYMKELFPNGYSRPVSTDSRKSSELRTHILSFGFLESLEQRRMRRVRTSAYRPPRIVTN